MTTMTLTSCAISVEVAAELTETRRHDVLWQAGAAIVAELRQLTAEVSVKKQPPKGAQKRMNELQLDLFRLYVATGRDPTDRHDWQWRDHRMVEVLMAANDRLCHKLANKYHPANLPDHQRSYDDMLQNARLALLSAIHRFKPARGLQFSTFALPSIEGPLKRTLGQLVHPAHITDGDQDLVANLSKAVSANNGVMPPTAMLPEKLQQLPSRRLKELGGMLASRAYASLDEAVTSDHHSSVLKEVTLGDTLDDPNGKAIFDRLVEMTALRAAMAELTHQERNLIVDRFIRELQWAETAERANVTKHQAHLAVKGALAHLRQFLEDDPGELLPVSEHQLIPAGR